MQIIFSHHIVFMVGSQTITDTCTLLLTDVILLLIFYSFVVILYFVHNMGCYKAYNLSSCNSMEVGGVN